jgi:hypothetical protein
MQWPLDRHAPGEPLSPALSLTMLQALMLLLPATLNTCYFLSSFAGWQELTPKLEVRCQRQTGKHLLSGLSVVTFVEMVIVFSRSV